MTRVTGARERARTEIAEAIKTEARRQLADAGAARLSLRAVAREVGMVSSALYRYYASRDDLLTALIIDAYDVVGAAAERAVAADPAPNPAAPALDPVVRWTAGCHAVRRWALAHPHEYALLYGSPVPGYAAPEDTNAPASRVALALIGVAEDAADAGLLDPATVEPAVLRDAEQLVRRLGVRLHPAAMARLTAAWSQLFGLVGFEVFGQFHNVVHAREEFFDRAAADLGRGIGLRAPAA